MVFSAWILPGEADQYIAGSIILAAAPCTAMVFVWSYLTDGDPAYTLVQVSVNDLIMLVLFAPLVGFLVAGASALSVPFAVLLYSVVAFIVIPLLIGVALRHWCISQQGKTWFENACFLGSRRSPSSHCSRRWCSFSLFKPTTLPARHGMWLSLPFLYSFRCTSTRRWLMD